MKPEWLLDLLLVLLHYHFKDIKHLICESITYEVQTFQGLFKRFKSLLVNTLPSNEAVSNVSMKDRNKAITFPSHKQSF
jgi:hypothetical protein